MSLDNFVQEIWSTQLLIALRKQYVFLGLTNSNYQGEVNQSTDLVRINTPTALTINSPALGQPGSAVIDYETPLSTQQSLAIDQSLDWAFEVFDIEEVQANVNLTAAYVADGANGAADTVDANIAALYTDATVTESVNQSTYDAGTLQLSLIDAGVALSDANVPSAGRWLVCDPRTIGLIRRTYGINTSTEFGAGISVNGFIGRVEGFDIFESNNVVITAGPDVSHCLAGTNAAITFAMQVAPSVEAIRLIDTYGDGVRSYMQWGRKTVRPTSIVEWAVQHGA